jgi:hypothetical protein
LRFSLSILIGSGFFGPDSIRPFDRGTVERDLQANKFKTKDLTEAIKQALDPTEFDKEIKKLKDAQRKEDEGEAEEKDGKSKKRPTPAKKAPTPPAKKTPAPKAKPAPKANPTPAKPTKPAATEKKPAASIPAVTTLRKRRGTQSQIVTEETDNQRDAKRSVCILWVEMIRNFVSNTTYRCTAYFRNY